MEGPFAKTPHDIIHELREPFIKTVEDLRHNTVSMIKDVQSNLIPYFLDGTIKVVQYYRMNGVPYALTPEQTIIHVEKLRYKDLVKPTNDPVYMKPMMDLINENKIYPFLLFINNKFIKWSDITIVKDVYYSYIIADKTNAPLSEKIDIIMLPFNVYYSENNEVKEGYEEIFRFNNNGRLSEIGSTVVSVLDKYLVYDKYNAPLGDLVGHNVDFVPDKYKLFKENFIFFRNKKLYTRGDVQVNDLNILTLDNGNSNGEIDYKVFFHDDANSPANNVLRMQNTPYVNSVLQNAAKNPDDEPYYVKRLKEGFDFKFDNKKDYAQNVRDAIDYIYDYNPLLLVPAFKSPVHVVTYTGTQINELVKDQSLIMLRLKADKHETYMIPFLNGELYPYYENVTYSLNTFNIPVYEPLKDDDILEIMYFKFVDNTILRGKVTKEDGYVGLGDYILKPYLEVYADRHVNMEYPTIGFNSRLAYKIDPIYDEETGIMTFDDDYYYGRELAFVGKNRFIYVGYNITKKAFKFQLSDDFKYCSNQLQFMVFVNGRRLNNDEYNITILKHTRPFDDLWLYSTKVLNPGDKLAVFYLPMPLSGLVKMVPEEMSPEMKTAKTFIYDIPVPYPNFLRYGNTFELYDDEDNLIDQSNYTINTDENILEFIQEFSQPNKIKFKFIYKNEPGIHSHGYIYVNKDKLKLPLSKDLYFIFVNGKKVPQTSIVDISSDTLRISTDIESTNNISIVQYANPIFPFETFLKEHDSILDDIANSVIREEMDNLMGTYNTISDVEDPMIIEASKISIINEIVRDFWMRPEINDGTPFLYDYDTDAFYMQDSEGNWIIPAMDATQFINIVEETEYDDEWQGLPYPDTTDIDKK